MTKYENLMVTAMEESGELVQAISKELRFGLTNHYSDKPKETNADHIITEFIQLEFLLT